MSTWVATGTGADSTLTTTGNATVQGNLFANVFATNRFLASTIDAQNIQQSGQMLIPAGIICMWSGSEAPAGWALCDGRSVRRIQDGVQVNTPDLRGRFVLGLNQTPIISGGTTLSGNTIGNFGGTETHTLTPDEIPSHTHTYANWRVKGQYDSYKRSLKEGAGNSFTMLDTNGNEPSEPTWTTSAVGSGRSHNNMPPFYVLAYIMKL
jgi:microcystin-dependent protein